MSSSDFGMVNTIPLSWGGGEEVAGDALFIPDSQETIDRVDLLNQKI
jgi:hypothetical protein